MVEYIILYCSGPGILGSPGFIFVDDSATCICKKARLGVTTGNVYTQLGKFRTTLEAHNQDVTYVMMCAFDGITEAKVHTMMVLCFAVFWPGGGTIEVKAKQNTGYVYQIRPQTLTLLMIKPYRQEHWCLRIQDDPRFADYNSGRTL